ncbi:PilZ domain-containing protein [Altererythrobacter sp. KTW20L]|uniref:PilZ domain-containing protein n=1 Tax=Altererythrobacter sp. KTW20L TaxID=2942210 RepID=UPI0020BE2B67|nr:PilZ domain-containing protein [Altererythrobacter sp. KTW20L]MCL6252257.1 PilZ domain-containing protein [Altererythrobacter sp. KTW20L]
MRKALIARPIARNFINQNQIQEIADRRDELRVQTVMRVARIIADRDEGLVCVKNLSDTGACLRLSIPVRLGEKLTLEMVEGEAISASIIWTDGRECGLRFDQSIDCAELLSRRTSSAERGISRPLRLNISKPAVVRSECGLLLAAVEDVSHRGMKIRHDGSLNKNMVVKVTLPSGLARSGVVRWSRGNIAGVLLLEPFCTDELGSSRAL